MKAIRLSVALIGLTLTIIFVAQFQKTTRENETQVLEQTITDKMMLCYINEGRYPPSLEYLEANYELHYDKTRYQVFLMPIGENIRPDLTVFAYE